MFVSNEQGTNARNHSQEGKAGQGGGVKRDSRESAKRGFSGTQGQKQGRGMKPHLEGVEALLEFLRAGVEALSWRAWLSPGRPGPLGQCNLQAAKKPRSPGRERG